MKNAKDTIYIDVDDEITSIIDKVQNTTEKVVALVLPKRASMLQSSVNMKLLKRAAEKAKKSLVLITTEAGLLPLASSVGLYVAKNLQSKPAIPTVKEATSALDELVKEDDGVSEEDFDPKLAANTAIGELATEDLIEGKIPAKPELTPLPYKRASDEEESVMLDNSTEDEVKEDPKGKKDKTKKDKSLKVPNFERFRLVLILGVLLLLILIGGFVYANSVLPKAVVTISTNTSTVSASAAITLSPTATTLDTNKLIVPAKIQSTPETASKQVTTTGQSNQGQTATGSIKIVAVVCSSGIILPPSSIPSGVGFSSSGLTFITQQTTTFAGSVNDGNNCQKFSGITKSGNSTTITAQAAGSKYNLGSNSSPASFASSYQDSQNSNTVYSGSGVTSGGTDSIVQIVSQADISNATAAITMPPTASVKSTLDSALIAAGYYPIDGTYTAGTPVITQTANVGSQATSVTVTEAVTYTLYGVHQSDLNTLLNNNINQQINTAKQSIQNNGFSQVTFNGVTASPTLASLTMQTTATVGPLLNIAQLKVQIEGQKQGDVATTIEQNPGVTGVKVKFSPFWVSSTPKNPAKITIIVKKAT